LQPGVDCRGLDFSGRRPIHGVHFRLESDHTVSAALKSDSIGLSH
jgi:hypothetical protein